MTDAATFCGRRRRWLWYCVICLDQVKFMAQLSTSRRVATARTLVERSIAEARGGEASCRKRCQAIRALDIHVSSRIARSASRATRTLRWMRSAATSLLASVNAYRAVSVPVSAAALADASADDKRRGWSEVRLTRGTALQLPRSQRELVQRIGDRGIFERGLQAGEVDGLVDLAGGPRRSASDGQRSSSASIVERRREKIGGRAEDNTVFGAYAGVHRGAERSEV